MTSTLYEPIMVALLTLLQNGTSGVFSTYQRGIVMLEQLAQAKVNNQPLRQPALFLYDGVGFGEGKIKYEQRGRSRPPVRIIERTIVLYAKAPVTAGQTDGSVGGPIAGVTATGGPVFHPLIEAVEAVFQQTDSQGALTLGNLVSHCWLEGEGVLIPTEIDPVNGQGMATLPVKIMVP